MRFSMRRFALGLALSLFISLGVASAQNCGLDHDITFAGLDWNSAQFHNEIARFVLEEGFGCDTADIPGSTVPMIQGLIRGDIDVNMEVWFNNAPEEYHAAVEEGTVTDLGLNMAGVEGFFVPRYVIEGDAERGIEAMAPDLRSVEDLGQYADLFTDPEQPDKGRFYSCIIGWQCETINNVKYYAYGMDENFTNFKPGTGAALASEIEAAYAQGEPILTYYWGPTWVLGDFDMVMLEEPAYDEATWNEMRTLSEANTPEEATAATAYPESIINVAVSEEMRANAPEEIINFLADYEIDQLVVSQYLAQMKNEGLEARDAALNFLEENVDLWSAWLPEDVAQQVIDAL